jgi:hypothetical protein
LFDSGQPKSESILRYLAETESREANPHLADDVRIAWLTVLHAASGVCDAWGYSFWQFFGKTYPKALLAWAERGEVNRKSLERCAALVRAEKEHTCASIRNVDSQRNLSAVTEADDRYNAAGRDKHEGSRAERSVPAQNLYESARAILASPVPKKPARSVKPRERAA